MLEHVRKVHHRGQAISPAAHASGVGGPLPNLSRQFSINHGRQHLAPSSYNVDASELRTNHCSYLKAELEATEAEKESMERAFEDEVEALRIAKESSMRKVERKIEALVAAVEVMERQDGHETMTLDSRLE